MSEAHPEPGFWRTYVFSTDHKMIGIQYGITALLFLLFGFCLMMMMRWQLAYPGEAIPIILWSVENTYLRQNESSSCASLINPTPDTRALHPATSESLPLTR